MNPYKSLDEMPPELRKLYAERINEMERVTVAMNKLVREGRRTERWGYILNVAWAVIIVAAALTYLLGPGLTWVTIPVAVLGVAGVAFTFYKLGHNHERHRWEREGHRHPAPVEPSGDAL